MANPSIPIPPEESPPDSTDSTRIAEHAERSAQEPLTRRAPTYDESDIADPDKTKQKRTEFFHSKLKRRDTVDVNDLPVYTPKGLVQKRDSHGNRWLQPNFIYVFTGRTRSGKSFLLKQLMFYLLQDPYWNFQWGEAYSGSGLTTDDLDFLHPNQIHEEYDNDRMRYQLQSCHEQLKALKSKKSEAELQRGFVILDDQIGSLTSTETNMRNGPTAQTWRFLATRGMNTRLYRGAIS